MMNEIVLHLLYLDSMNEAKFTLNLNWEVIRNNKNEILNKNLK
jgi:hypothetical protein